MSGDQEAVRVAVRAILAAALAGLLVLLFQGAAFAASPEDLAEQLVDSEEVSAAPLSRAEELLRAQQRMRWLRLHEAVVETGLRAWTSGSPRKVLSSARDVVGELWNWTRRSENEDLALEWLELEVRGRPEPDPVAVELYQELRAREQAALVENGLARADAAVESGRGILASVQLQQVLDIDPDSEAAISLLDRLERLETGSPVTDELQESLEAVRVEDWEVPLAAALLRGDYADVLAGAPETPSGRFAFSAAQYLSGSPESAVDGWEELEARSDAVGSLARAWVAREDVNPGAAFDREERQYKLRRVLGFLGGHQLADDGVELSSDMVRAWRDSMTPLNVAVSMPARLYRGWHPDGEALREAALAYVSRIPQGERAADAKAWLDQFAGESASIPSASFRESFVLPPATTEFPRLSPSPLHVTRNVLDSVFVSDAGPIREALGSSSSVVLEARTDLQPGDGLSPERARRFLAELSFALEQGEFYSLGHGRTATHEAIRRLERAVDRGAVLTAEPAEFDSTNVWGTFTRAYIDGEYETVGALTLSRGKDELRAERHFGRGRLECPARSFCVDRAMAVRSTLYTRLDTDSDLQLALAAEFQGARMTMSMLGSGGPHASIVLPVGRWLGVGAWLPIAAQVAVGTDSFYVGPTLSK